MDEKLAGHSSIPIFCVQGWIYYLSRDLINETSEACQKPPAPEVGVEPVNQTHTIGSKGNIEMNPSYYEQDAKVNDISLSFCIQSDLLFHNTLFNNLVFESPINTYVFTLS